MHHALNKRRFLVVTPNIVVGEDLREAMLARENTEVDVFASLSSLWKEPYDMAIFGCDVEDVLSNRRIQALREAGTRIVILNDFSPTSALEGTSIGTLAQPFTTEDVNALIGEIDATQQH